MAGMGLILKAELFSHCGIIVVSKFINLSIVPDEIDRNINGCIRLTSFVNLCLYFASFSL